MDIEVHPIAFDVRSGSFPCQAIREKIQQSNPVSIQEYFFESQGLPYFAIVVKSQTQLTAVFKSETAKDVTKELDESEVKFYDRLREVRARHAKVNGVPPYVLFTNKQLVDIIRKRPQSLAELQRIEGIGKAKAEKYGGFILELTQLPELQ